MSEYHMNITFLIGNGYDMNIGLKTGYQAFLEWYITQENANDIISANCKCKLDTPHE